MIFYCSYIARVPPKGKSWGVLCLDEIYVDIGEKIQIPEDIWLYKGYSENNIYTFKIRE